MGRLSDYGNISGSPSGWSTRSLGNVVLFSAGLMAKVPALSILCAEETQRLAAGKFVFKGSARSCYQLVVVVEGQGDASASPWSSTEAPLESSALSFALCREAGVIAARAPVVEFTASAPAAIAAHSPW